MKYRKKPVVIEAHVWDGKMPTLSALHKWSGISFGVTDGKLVIPTLEGNMRADKGDFIIQGVQGEFYPCKPDIFKATYEPVEAKQPTVSDIIQQDARVQTKKRLGI